MFELKSLFTLGAKSHVGTDVGFYLVFGWVERLSSRVFKDKLIVNERIFADRHVKLCPFHVKILIVNLKLLVVLISQIFERLHMTLS